MGSAPNTGETGVGGSAVLGGGRWEEGYEGNTPGRGGPPSRAGGFSKPMSQDSRCSQTRATEDRAQGRGQVEKRARLSFGRGETVCHAPGISQMVPKREFQFPEWEVFSNGERILII